MEKLTAEMLNALEDLAIYKSDKAFCELAPWCVLALIAAAREGLKLRPILTEFVRAFDDWYEGSESVASNSLIAVFTKAREALKE